MKNIELTIDGRAYVAIERDEYERLTAHITPGQPSLVDAKAYIRGSLGKTLLQARTRAGLTQAELAKKLEKSQPTIAAAETGRMKVGERYVAAVLRACKLPKDWSGSEEAAAPRTRKKK